MAAQLSSTGISHHNILPHMPSNRLSTVNNSPCPRIVPQSLNSSSQLLRLRTSVPVQGMYGCSKDCLILIPFRLPQVSCFTFSLKCFPSDSDNCPLWGLDPCFSSPLAKGRSSPTNCPVFLPSSFILPSFAWFYTFFSEKAMAPHIQYSCLENPMDSGAW